ncbi:MAG: serine hydrolase [bacterium]|nr:serine hydrolase [bacterium]
MNRPAAPHKSAPTWRGVIASLAVALAGAIAPLPALAQVEEILDDPAGWTFRYGATSADITADINNGLRPFSIQRVAANSYDVITVANSGSYAVSGFGTGNMHYNRTASQLGLELVNRRLVSLDCYEESGVTRITAISVPNTGAGSTGWGWLVGQSLQQIVDWVEDATPAIRITDLSIYTVGGQKYYAALAVYNEGSQYQGWWWYFDKTEAEIAALLTQNSARLIDIELETAPSLFNGARFAAVMVAQNPGGGWFDASSTGTQTESLIGQTGGRLTSLHRYTTALGTTAYAVSLVDNANDQTRRVRGYMGEQATQGAYGFKLKQVGGPVIASLNENFVFEPASTMKILHGVGAIRECAQGDLFLDGSYWVPNRCTSLEQNNVCPDDSYSCDSGYEPLETTLRGMLRSSHNGRTRTIEELVGRSTLNNFADFTAGLTNTQINHTLGCLCGNTPNTTTAADLTSLYEQIADGSFFSSTWSEELFGIMANVTDWGYGTDTDEAFNTLRLVINDEAAQTDLTSSEILSFRAALQFSAKGGDYGCGGVSWRSTAGWYSIPFKFYSLGTWFTTRREYTVATFVDAGVAPGSAVAYYAAEELVREQIREALETWDDACTPGFASQPTNLTVDQGDDAEFTVTVASPGTATYQWERYVDGSWETVVDQRGQAIGATTNTLTILAAEPDDEGFYRCHIVKACGLSDSHSARLTVDTGGASPATLPLPTHLVVHAPKPNPFNPQVTLSFELPRHTDVVVLELFDVAGRRVRSLSASSLAPGAHAFTWNGTDDAGQRLSSGLYFARLRADQEEVTHRVMMVE